MAHPLPPSSFPSEWLLILHLTGSGPSIGPGRHTGRGEHRQDAGPHVLGFQGPVVAARASGLLLLGAPGVLPKPVVTGRVAGVLGYGAEPDPTRDRRELPIGRPREGHAQPQHEPVSLAVE